MIVLNIDKLSTEQRNPNSYKIDELSSLDLVKTINEEDKKVAFAVEKELESIAKAVDAISERFVAGGRIIYCGAGTSGRLGVLDAVELTPTYSISHDRVFGVIAGGEKAMYVAVEGAEDSIELGVADMEALNLRGNDTVIGIAASGRTPYTIAAIEYANQKGALTVSVCCNNNSLLHRTAQIGIAPLVGPEVVTGSTRMKAGTAQKLVLNTLSTSVMAKTGKLYSNLMVNVQATNLKLVERSINILRDANELSYEDAKILLADSDNNIPVAIVMYQSGAAKSASEKALEQDGNNIKKAIKSLKEA